MEALLEKMIPAAPVQTKGYEVIEFEPQPEPEVSQEDIISQVSPAVDAMLLQLMDLGVNVDQGLHYSMNQKDLYLELIRDFVTGWKKKKENLNTYYSEQNWNEYQILVHSIKSTSKTIGMNDLSAAARNLELAAIDQNSGFIAEHHKTFIEDGECVIEKLDDILLR
jgi:HPt (histidine-containing phosphotransfer) domain-containing protein